MCHTFSVKVKVKLNTSILCSLFNVLELSSAVFPMTTVSTLFFAVMFVLMVIFIFSFIYYPLRDHFQLVSFYQRSAPDAVSLLWPTTHTLTEKITQSFYLSHVHIEAKPVIIICAFCFLRGRF